MISQKLLMKLGNMPGIVKTEDVFVTESLIKLLYFGNNHNYSSSLNELSKDQLNQNATNDLKKPAPSSSAIYMQISRTSHIAGCE